MDGFDFLSREAREFVEAGTRLGFANPETRSEETRFDGKYIRVGGQELLDFTRLDYISLGSSDEVKAVMTESIIANNLSCPSSQMVLKSASTERLERAISDFHGMRASVMFTAGYPANENVMQAIGLRMNTPHLLAYVKSARMGNSSRHVPTVFFVDSESHYSLQHGIRLACQASKGRCQKYEFPSGEYARLADQLKASIVQDGERAVRVIVTDTLSSISGRFYDMEAVCCMAEEYGAWVYADEAHAVGAIGMEGRGVTSGVPGIERFRDRLIIMGTLTKTVCQMGGYVTVSEHELATYLSRLCPQYIFSAPIAPWMADVIVRVMELIKGDYGKDERAKLAHVASHMRGLLKADGFDMLGSESHIIPVVVGDIGKGKLVKSYLEERGYSPALFIYPAVPRNIKALLRFSLCSDVTVEEAEGAVKALMEARDRYKF